MKSVRIDFMPSKSPAGRSTRSEVSEERLERLVAAGTLLTSELSLEGVIQQTVTIAAEVIGARYAAIGVLAPDGRLLESFTTYGITPEERALIGPPPRGHGILGLVIREVRVIRLPDLTRHPDSYGFPPHHPPMHSFLGAPIAGRRGVFGNLYLTEKLGGGYFTEDDERIVVLLAAQTAAAVENARLHEESARLIEEVQQLHRSRERFFAMVNHELRNALAATYGWAEMLVRRKDPATVPAAAFEVLDSAEQAVGLINDLLDLSRLDEDRLRPVIRAVDPEAVARRAVVRVTPPATAKRINLTTHVAARLPTSNTDASRLEQILVNLLGNAIRHAPEDSEVQLSLDRNGDKIVIRVEDQGSGIAPDDVERIFDIYVTKAAEEGHGVGLGLPLSRRLARLLGGELSAVSRPGRGGCFVLELPAAPAE
jgi:signal transduction histidine kinase